MSLYRGQDIGSPEQLREKCLAIIEKGSHQEIYEVLPHIRILRSPDFEPPLIRLLKTGNHKQKAAAAMALGSLGNEACIEELCQALEDALNQPTRGSETVQAAIISSLGELGSEAGVEPLMEVYRRSSDTEEPSQVERRLLLIAALGQLAQQGIVPAQQRLAWIISEEEPRFQVPAISELSVAFWHCPNAIADTTLHKIASLTDHPSPEVRRTATGALSNLAKLGCHAAEEMFRKS